MGSLRLPQSTVIAMGMSTEHSSVALHIQLLVVGWAQMYITVTTESESYALSPAWLMEVLP